MVPVELGPQSLPGQTVGLIVSGCLCPRSKQADIDWLSSLLTLLFCMSQCRVAYFAVPICPSVHVSMHKTVKQTEGSRRVLVFLDSEPYLPRPPHQELSTNRKESPELLAAFPQLLPSEPPSLPILVIKLQSLAQASFDLSALTLSQCHFFTPPEPPRSPIIPPGS